MDDWHIRDEVVFIFVENTSTSDNIIARLKVDFSSRRNLYLQGLLFHVRIRNGVRYLVVIKRCKAFKKISKRWKPLVQDSETRCKAFKKIVTELQHELRL
ncbi:hypothetical protein LIER_32459 [Lithospermum erythrorhizon]|uniref:Uncharacterized protein n=1 Tax=Lithospermum erythrorhizon TaxID=34254 RepID=A0AAV3RZT7_LITER